MTKKKLKKIKKEREAGSRRRAEDKNDSRKTKVRGITKDTNDESKREKG